MSLLHYNIDRISSNILIIAAFGLAGLLVFSPFARLASRAEPRSNYLPLPHHVAKYPDGVSFRFAMVHDVIHERYSRHGKAYYRERNRLVRAEIDKIKDADGLPPADRLDLIDDLGVGLDVLGEDDEAVNWLRLKLRKEEKLGKNGKDLYVTYANLGTFLIHGNMAAAFKGDKDAEQRVREGIDFLHKGIAVNPQAHFGREIWQAVTAECMLRVSADRRLLLKYDLVGNKLNERGSDEYLPHSMNPSSDNVKQGICQATDDFLNNLWYAQGRSAIRGNIRQIKATVDAKSTKVPFDEPCLGIIGMWRLGGGANPHFALALGEIMLRVNQRRLAWAAFERAIREAPRLPADETVRGKFIEHCRSRQESLGLREEDTKHLEAEFEEELRVGLDYQSAYQKYEEEQIAAGADLFDAHFYDGFDARHGSIATPVGTADFLEVHDAGWPKHGPTILSIGVGAAVGARLVLRFGRRRPDSAKPT
jgi:hypothetical protein